MAELSSRKVLSRKKSGFSLIAVLIISLIGLAAVGAALQFANVSSGAGTMSSALSVKYNILQDAVEEGKARLKRSMDNLDPPHRYFDKASVPEDTVITQSDMLLLADEYTVPGEVSPRPLGYREVPLGRGDLTRLGIPGDSGELVVRIYDMQYDPEKIAEVGTESGQIAPAELALLPPSVSVLGADDFEIGITTDAPDYDRTIGHGLSANNTGVYLIRASLSVTGAGSEMRAWTLDTSIIQSNNR
ncbi:MAG: hypothetical protein LBR87_07660 [Synergistaceae bacterium]|jgi:hypothetical protein|nr:hypothetical protein [Synergistaceae bacterium]